MLYTIFAFVFRSLIETLFHEYTNSLYSMSLSSPFGVTRSTLCNNDYVTGGDRHDVIGRW